MARLPRGFFARPAVEVAPDLLGRILVRRTSEGLLLKARIVETEAYERDDPASHSFRGETPRNRVMFGRPGHLYVYLTYGMHWCMNAVTGLEGHGSAVLLRAGEPLEGLEAMAANRGTERPRELCRGPARWAQAFSVTGNQDALDLVRGREMWIEPGSPTPPARIVEGPRIGIRRATDLAWRFHVAGSPWVSGGSPTPVAREPSPPRS